MSFGEFDESKKKSKNYSKGATHDAVFDGVMLCSGHHTTPNWPQKFRGQDDFKGRIIHSHSYKVRNFNKKISMTYQ